MKFLKAFKVMALLYLAAVPSAFSEQGALKDGPFYYQIWSVRFHFTETISAETEKAKEKIIDRKELEEMLGEIGKTKFKIIRLSGMEKQTRRPVVRGARLTMENFVYYKSMAQDLILSKA
jgi:hypothetical protein